jgi:hypothetical protein
MENLAELKSKYALLQGRYNLPAFNELNLEFSIEKIAENETDFVLREIRRFIAEQLSNYLRFLETLLNPVNSTVFVFSILKILNSDNKKTLEEIYQKLIKIELEVMGLDLDYSEEKEAEFIKKICMQWKEIKPEWKKILDLINKSWENKSQKNEKSYFG